MCWDPFLYQACVNRRLRLSSKALLMALSSSTPCLRVLVAESTHHWITFTVVLLSLSQPLDLVLRTTWGWANRACSAISPSAAVPPLSMCNTLRQNRQFAKTLRPLSSSFLGVSLMIFLSFWLWLTDVQMISGFTGPLLKPLRALPSVLLLIFLYPSIAGKSKTKRKHFRNTKRPNYWNMPFFWF